MVISMISATRGTVPEDNSNTLTHTCAFCGLAFHRGKPGSASFGDSNEVRPFCAGCLDEMQALSDFSDLVDRAGVADGAPNRCTNRAQD